MGAFTKKYAQQVTCLSQYTHTPCTRTFVGSVRAKKIQVMIGIFHGIPQESIQ